MKNAFTPYRSAEIVALAKAAATKFAGLTLDAVAEMEGIMLIRLSDAQAEREGFCCIIESSRPKRFLSRATGQRDGISFTEHERVAIPAIVINPARCTNEAEVFWHEYYHIQYSPNRPTSATFFGGYSTSGVLDKQEERRANLFAACVLRPATSDYDPPNPLAEKFVNSRLNANLRIEPTL